MATLEREWRWYITDDGTQYAVHQPIAWRGKSPRQWDSGPEAPFLPQLPAGIRMRTVHLKKVSGEGRRQWPFSRPMYDTHPAIGDTINLPSIDGTLIAWKVVGYSMEANQPAKYRRLKRR